MGRKTLNSKFISLERAISQILHISISLHTTLCFLMQPFNSSFSGNMSIIMSRVTLFKVSISFHLFWSPCIVLCLAADFTSEDSFTKSWMRPFVKQIKRSICKQVSCPKEVSKVCTQDSLTFSLSRQSIEMPSTLKSTNTSFWSLKKPKKQWKSNQLRPRSAS